MSVMVRIWLALLLLALGAYGGFTLWRIRQQPPDEPAAQYTIHELFPDAGPPRPLSDFTFTERNGDRVNLQSLEGQVWIGSFFFASCPDFCSQMNQIISELQTEMYDQGVKIVSISVDPTHDTPQVLTEYAKAFKADPKRWLFLTGTLADAQSLGQSVFHITVQGKEHSDRIVLVDRRGEVRGTYRSRDTGQMTLFRKKLAEVLAEPTEATAAAPASETTQTTTEKGE